MASLSRRRPRDDRAVLGLFRTADEAAQAMTALRGAGFGGDSLEVLSDSPYPEGAFGEEKVKHHLYLFPLFGAACGFAAGLFLTIGTQIAYPVVTGGKPILSIPPMINVVYEGTLLAAIVMTVWGVIYESGLPASSDAPYDPRISEGYLGVMVTAPATQLAEAERALRDANAVDVVRSTPANPDTTSVASTPESAGTPNSSPSTTGAAGSGAQ
jgi:hypothetical protein